MIIPFLAACTFNQAVILNIHVCEEKQVMEYLCSGRFSSDFGACQLAIFEEFFFIKNHSKDKVVSGLKLEKNFHLCVFFVD